MKLKNSKNIELHNYVDYTIGALLLFSPLLFSMKLESIDAKIIFTIGLAVILQNTITKHRLGLAKILKKKTHQKIDLFLGWLLAVSPFLFGFFGNIVLPHFLFGSILILNAFLLPLAPKKNKYSVILKKDELPVYAD
jgi:uncharacterized protein with PQ loop repeat